LSGNNWPQVSIAVLIKQTLCQVYLAYQVKDVNKTTF